MPRSAALGANRPMAEFDPGLQRNDLEEVYGIERHLLYVACTRARDRAPGTGVHAGSEFLEDLQAGE